MQRKSFCTACHSGKLKLTFTAQMSFQLAPKTFDAQIEFFCNLNSSKKFTGPSGKLITEFTSPIANPLAPAYRTLLSLHTDFIYM